jgi:hypothetical protein
VGCSDGYVSPALHLRECEEEWVYFLDSWIGVFVDDNAFTVGVYFPRKNGHVILGFFGVLSKESGDSVPRTPWDFSL